MRKKIVFILPHLNGGGAERVSLNYLRTIDRSIFEPILIVFDKTYDLLHLVPEGIEIIDCKTISVSRSFWATFKEIKRLKPDFIFTSDNSITFLLALCRIWLRRNILISRIPGSPRSEIENKEYSKIKFWLFKYGLRRADWVIVQTEEMRLEALQYYKINEKQCVVLANLLDEALIRESIEVPFNDFDPTKFNIVASGRLHKVKGFDLLIKSIPKVIQFNKNIHLFILGSDKGAEGDLKKLIADLALEHYVTLKGFISNPYPYYFNCDLFVMTSVHEGFPNSLLENYYLNTPLISTKCAKIVTRLIEPKVNGFIIESLSSDCISENIKKAFTLCRADISNPVYQGESLNFFLITHLNV